MALLYTPYKIFHYSEKINSLTPGDSKILPPIHIRIKPTNMCGHSCWYCAYKADDLQLGSDMEARDQIPEEKMMEILEDIIEMGVKAVTFSGGGDPFLYKPLLKTVKRLADSPIQFASLTNGARLDGELAEVFAHHGTWLRVSLDGWDDESYSQYRSIRLGEFTKLMDRLKNFKRLNGKCYLGISLIVDQKNAAHVYDTVSRLKDLGVDSVKVSACIVSNDSKESNAYQQPVFGLVRQQVDRLLAETSNSDFEVFDAYHELDEKFDKDYTWCPFLQMLCVIGADLNVYSCQDKAYTPTGQIGSIKTQRFSTFWSKGKEKFYKINPSLHCNHHCVANLKNQMILQYLNADQNHSNFV